MHRPVMLQEVLAWLQPRAGGIYLDGTTGAGGHSVAILEASGPDGRIVGLDRDATAVATARQALRPYGDRALIVQAAYGDAPHVVRETTERNLDGALLDLGVSSLQLDTPARGFSFMANGPLDMRMDVRDSVTAADLVNRLPEKELARILEEHGEERYARRITKGIVRRRAQSPVLTTRPITPSAQECVENPRARSAKLRVLAAREAAA